jgi:hypothetical protein
MENRAAASVSSHLTEQRSGQMSNGYLRLEPAPASNPITLA